MNEGRDYSRVSFTRLFQLCPEPDPVDFSLCRALESCEGGVLEGYLLERLYLSGAPEVEVGGEGQTLGTEKLALHWDIIIPREYANRGNPLNKTTHWQQLITYHESSDNIPKIFTIGRDCDGITLAYLSVFVLNSAFYTCFRVNTSSLVDEACS